jgi:hypothetical protein
MRLFNRKPQVVTVTPTEIVKAPSTTALAMQTLARTYTRKAWNVLYRSGIKATPIPVYYTPRYIGVGFVLADSTQVGRATAANTLSAMALEAGLSGQVNGVTWEQVNRALYYQFLLPKAAILKRHLVKPQYLGLGPSNKPIPFGLRVPHTLVGGMTGSGKSVLLDNILYALYHMGQDQQWLIIDPQQDHTEWSDTKYLGLPVAILPDEITEALTTAADEAARRIAHRGEAHKPIYLVIDEAEGSEALSNGTHLALAREVADKGRKVNMHIILATHRPAHAELRGVAEACGQRYLGRVANAQKSGEFGAGLNLHLLAGEGDFIYEHGGNRVRFQVCMLEADQIRQEIAHTTPVPAFQGVPEVIAPSRPVVSLARALPVPIRSTGRPTIEPEPKYVAFFLYHGAESVGPSLMDELFDLKQTGYARNKEWALEIEKWFKVLQDNEGRYL